MVKISALRYIIIVLQKLSMHFCHDLFKLHRGFPGAHTGFQRLVWALLLTSWGIALLSLGLSLSRWAAIGHTGGWVDWLPMPVLPVPALLAGLQPPPCHGDALALAGAALECIPAWRCSIPWAVCTVSAVPFGGGRVRS